MPNIAAYRYRQNKPLLFISRRPEYCGDYGDSIEVRAYYEEMLGLGFRSRDIAAAFNGDPGISIAAHRARIEKTRREIAVRRVDAMMAATPDRELVARHAAQLARTVEMMRLRRAERRSNQLE